MSTLFLVDANTNPIANSDINEARYNATSAPMLGSFVVRVPDTAPLLSEPSTLSGLVTAKYQALLAYYATFSNIVFEDMTDTPGVNGTLSLGVYAGDRMSTKIVPSGVLRTNVTALGGTPAQAIITWESYTLTNTNPKTGRLTRVFDEASSASFTVAASFDNGATFNAVSDGGLFSIPAPSQGSNFILRFTNTSGSNRWLGSWSVLF